MKVSTSILVLTIVLASALTGCGGGYGAGVSIKLPPTPTPAPAPEPVPESVPESIPESIATPTEPGFEGIWQAPAYGTTHELTKTEEGTYHIKSYLVTSISCLLDFDFNGISVDTLQQLGALSDDKNQFEEKSNGVDILPGIVYTRTEALPESCQQENYPLKGEAGYQFNANRDFEIFWHTLNEQYLDFTLSGTNWDEVYAQSKPKVAGIETEEQLFALFSEMITPLNNGHNFISLKMEENGDERQFFSVVQKPSIEDKFTQEYIQKHSLEPPLSKHESEELDKYVQQQGLIVTENTYSFAKNVNNIVIEANDNIGWFKTHDNIGYIFLHSMGEYSGEDSSEDSTFLEDLKIANETIDAALTDLQGVEGLVVDIRQNEGGYDEVSVAYASRFLDGSTHLYSKQARLGHGRTPLVDIVVEPHDGPRYLGPVVVLTSASTASAAEVFAMAMRSLPAVTMIGERTAGAFSDVLISRVTSDIFFGFSNEYYLSSTGEWFEQQGVPVDIEVPFATKEQRQFYIDQGLQEATDFLLEQ